MEYFGTFKICFLYVQKEGICPFILHTEQPLRDSWLLRNGQNCSIHQILEIRFIKVYLLVFLVFQRCQSQKRQQLKLMSTKSIPNYVLSHVIKRICPQYSKLQRIDIVYKGKKVEVFFLNTLQWFKLCGRKNITLKNFVKIYF